MRAHAWTVLVVGLFLQACVLPDYTLPGESQPRKDAGADSSASAAATAANDRAAMLFPEAEPACERCVGDNCQAELRDCGEDCAQLTWPVSPAWRVTDAVDPYVRCLARSCEDSCQVRWGCTKHYIWPEPSAAYPVTIRVTDAIRGDDLAGIRVTACQARDPGCEQDIGLISTGVTNGMGRAVLTLNDEFYGYFLLEEVQTEKDGESFVPMTVIWSQPVYRTESVLTASMFKPSWISAIASSAEMVQDGKGHLIFKAQNCLPERYVGDAETNADADGVMASYSALGNGSRVYYTGTAVSLNLMATATSPEGLSFGGAFNLSPGPVTVTAVHDDVEVASGGFPMRADTIGAIFLVPRAMQ